MNDRLRDALIGTETVSATPGMIAERMGVEVDPVTDLLADLDQGGLLRVYEGPGGEISFSLTRSGSATLGLESVSGRWAPAGVGCPVDAGAVRRARGDRSGTMRCDGAGNPMPTVFLGEGMPWDNLPHERCPACKGLTLPPHVYCLYCDRWGLDAAARGRGGGRPGFQGKYSEPCGNRPS